MKFNFIKFSIMMAITMVVVSACEKDDVLPEPTPEDLTPFAMTYVDFITPNDVQILSADTTRISVSSAYAKKVGIKYFKDRAVTIWRTIGTAPFIRIITDAQENNGEIILTTKRGEFCDMFTDVEMSLVSDLYVNRDYVASRTSRNASGEEYTDVSDKYRDTDGVYHPAVIILDEDSPLAKSMQSRTGTTKNYFTAEELLAENATFNILNVQSDFIFDFQHPEKEQNPNGTGAAVHVKGKVGVTAQLSAYCNVKVGLASLQKFEAGVKGSAGLSAKASLTLQNQFKKKWQKELVPVGGHMMVFWVGPIPVPLVYESCIVQKVEAMATAAVDILASGKYTLSFEQGCLYEGGRWQDISKESKKTKAFKFDGIMGSARAEAKTGIFYQMGIYLGNSMGPEFAFGPSLSAEADVSASLFGNSAKKEYTVQGSLGAYAGLSGTIGTKIKFLGYELAKWDTSFDVFRLTLFKGSMVWNFSDDSWGKLQTEWTDMMDQSSEQWVFEETSKVVVPYRLAD